MAGRGRARAARSLGLQRGLDDREVVREVEDRCEGGRCFCPTNNTFQDGNVLARFLRNGHSTHSLGARARTYGPRIQPRTRADRSGLAR